MDSKPSCDMSDLPNLSEADHDGCGHTSRPGTSVGHHLAPSIEDFEIIKPISRGAFGKVFLCHRRDQPEKKLAVKVMKKNMVVQKNMVDQVIAERNALAITKSPFCVALLYSLQTTNNVFLVMEYMIGGDLKSLLGVYGFFPEQQAVFYLSECVLALQYLHKRGIVHRDIKPDNMLLSSTGHLKLTDFGLSTTGLRDRELHVADLVAKTPWQAGGQARLVRTPGQILSLTSHLSFSSAREEGGSGMEYGAGGSYFEGSTEQGCGVSDKRRVYSGSSDCLPPAFLSLSARREQPITPAGGGSRGYHPDSATPAAGARGRLLRKNSFTEALARHSLEQEDLLRRKMLDRLGSSPGGRDEESGQLDTSVESSRLQELPNSSLDLGHNKTIEFDTALLTPAKRGVEMFEDKENIDNFPASSPYRDDVVSSPYKDTISPRHADEKIFSLADEKISSIDHSLPNSSLDASFPLQHDEDSRGSISSSPKPFSILPPTQAKLNLSPVAHSPGSPVRNFSFSSPTSPDKPIPISSEKVTPIVYKVTPTSHVHRLTKPLVPSSSLACENMRNVRDIDDTLSQERLRCAESFDSDLHLDVGETGSRDCSRVSYSSPENSQMSLEVTAEEEGDSIETSQGDLDVTPGSTLHPSSDTLHPSSELDTSRFKMPCQLPSCRKRKGSDDSPQPVATTGLSGDLTNLVMSGKKLRVESVDTPQVQLDDDSPQTPPVQTEANSIPRHSSSSSSDEEQASGYGYSTPVQQLEGGALSALPNHMKGLGGKLFKAVKFVSPAGVTPVQHQALSSPGLMQDKVLAKFLPRSLADLDQDVEGSLEIATPPHPYTPPPCTPPTHRTTPYRTPKSVGKTGGRGSLAQTRILGTPDYLAPELLLRKGHSSAVDWWALGVCLYEFMVGIPPFSDSTPELVFNNILKLTLEWPEGDEALSEDSVSAILSLLTMEPGLRGDGDSLMAHPLTRGVDWANILDEIPPFVPNPDDATDTTYFNTRNSMQGLVVSGVDL